jgi:hypothetical protein
MEHVMADEKDPYAPLNWPEDDSAPPPESTHRGVGLPPPGGGALAAGGWEHNAGEDGGDTVTEYRFDEDEDAER